MLDQIKLSHIVLIVIVIVIFLLVARIPNNIMNALKQYDEKEKENNIDKIDKNSAE